MKAIVLGLNGVEIVDVEKPTINETQVLIEVYSSTINRSDLLETQGQSFGHVSGTQKILGLSLIHI